MQHGEEAVFGYGVEGVIDVYGMGEWEGEEVPDGDGDWALDGGENKDGEQEDGNIMLLEVQSFIVEAEWFAPARQES